MRHFMKMVIYRLDLLRLGGEIIWLDKAKQNIYLLKLAIFNRKFEPAGNIQWHDLHVNACVMTPLNTHKHSSQKVLNI